MFIIQNRQQSSTYWTSELHRQLPLSPTLHRFLSALAVKNKLHNIFVVVAYIWPLPPAAAASTAEPAASPPPPPADASPPAAAPPAPERDPPRPAPLLVQVTPLQVHTDTYV